MTIVLVSSFCVYYVVGLVLFDNFNGQCTEKVFQLLEDSFVLIPANCTDRLQPLDLSLNKPAKMFLCSKFQDWFAQQVASQKRGEKPVEPVDLRLSIMKPLGVVDEIVRSLQS